MSKKNYKPNLPQIEQTLRNIINITVTIFNIINISSSTRFLIINTTLVLSLLDKTATCWLI